MIYKQKFVLTLEVDQNCTAEREAEIAEIVHNNWEHSDTYEAAESHGLALLALDEVTAFRIEKWTIKEEL